MIENLDKSEDESLANKRMDICKKCKYFTIHTILPDSCGLCGCVLRIKTIFPSQHCPDKQW